jgi:prevent-host-death family protein
MNDKTMPTEEVRRELRTVLDLVQAGGSVTVTRSGKPVARIIPIERCSCHGVEDCPIPEASDAAVVVGKLLSMCADASDMAVRVGDRWGSLSEEQRAGLPVGTVIGIAGRSGPESSRTLRADGFWWDDSAPDDACRAVDGPSLIDARIITHIPEGK